MYTYKSAYGGVRSEPKYVRKKEIKELVKPTVYPQIGKFTHPTCTGGCSLWDNLHYATQVIRETSVHHDGEDTFHSRETDEQKVG